MLKIEKILIDHIKILHKNCPNFHIFSTKMSKICCVTKLHPLNNWVEMTPRRRIAEFFNPKFQGVQLCRISISLKKLFRGSTKKSHTGKLSRFLVFAQIFEKRKGNQGKFSKIFGHFPHSKPKPTLYRWYKIPTLVVDIFWI